MTTRLTFLVNGEPEGALGERARSLAAHLGGAHRPRLLYRSRRKRASALRFAAHLLADRPRVVYVFDMSYSGVLAGAFYRRAVGGRLAIETGDAITELARSTGSRGPLGVWATGLLEGYSCRVADRVVVRGTGHRRWLARRGIDAPVVPDGVDTELFAPRPAPELRRRLGLEGALVVGLVGSSVWSERLGTCYGWELVELLGILGGTRVKGLMVGDGSGIPRLQERCRRAGIEDRIVFTGRLPLSELPAYVNAMDVCLSTQTANLVGRVRTTGKLPLYLACGRYILASRVGEAARVLADEMLVPYRGVRDPGYPQRLAQRLRGLLDHPERLALGAQGVEIARERFDYRVVAAALRQVLDGLAAKEGRA